MDEEAINLIQQIMQDGKKLQMRFSRYHKIREFETDQPNNMELVMERSQLTNKFIPNEFSSFIADISLLPIDKSKFRDIEKHHFISGIEISRIEPYLNEYMDILRYESTNYLESKLEVITQVFVVHGHDESLKYETSSFLKDFPNIKPIVLHEQVSKGKTLLNKIDEYSDVQFAIILFSPDDKTFSESGEISFQARQNVVLELGYFVAKIGQNRVAVVKKGRIDMPSDIAGVVYIKYDRAGKWKYDVLKEMKSVGIEINLNDASF